MNKVLPTSFIRTFKICSAIPVGHVAQYGGMLEPFLKVVNICDEQITKDRAHASSHSTQSNKTHVPKAQNKPLSPPKKKKAVITSSQQKKASRKSHLNVHLHTKCLKNTQKLPSRSAPSFQNLKQTLTKTVQHHAVTSMLKKCDAPHQLHKIPAPCHFAAKF
ncbi:MAG: hypothetical protein KUG59_03695 [Parvibaculaceae bacterium]|nr:hypothetical protein [Parvibaculaceae bacterium]